jgi:hypothetical protein
LNRSEKSSRLLCALSPLWQYSSVYPIAINMQFAAYHAKALNVFEEQDLPVSLIGGVAFLVYLSRKT